MAQTKPAQPNQLLDALSQRYAVIKEGKPLAVGIHKAIIAIEPDISVPQLKVALKRHTNSTRYLKAVATGADRYDLAGAVAGNVTEEQKALAAETLKDRFRKAAERKREEEQAKERAVKLNQLVEKFSHR